MKKLIVLMLTMLFVLAISGTALASFQGGYKLPTAGSSPHGTYNTTSDKCKVCHAVHRADQGAGQETLLRSTRVNACNYCHVSTTFAIKRVYNSDPANYTTDTNNNHAGGHQGIDTAYSGCASCHETHGANCYDTAKILSKNPGGKIMAGNATGAIAADVTNQTDFCRDCHDSSTTEGATLWNSTDGCGQCHDDSTGDNPSKIYAGGARNGASHVMTTTTTGNYSTEVAFDTSETCRKCHKGGDTTGHADANCFPHMTTGMNFLQDAHTATSPLDRVCVECHQSGSSGVGFTF